MSDLTVRPDGPEGQPDNVTPEPLVLDAVVLMERRVEFIGHRILMTLPDSGPVEGTLANAFWRGWDTPLSQRIGITTMEGRTFLLGERVQITVEPLDDTDIRTALGADLERMGLMPEPAAPVCDASCCAGREVPWPDALNPHLPQPGYTPRPYGQGPEPERRTVSLEVLTDELRAAEHAARLAEAADTYTQPEPLPADARVAIVLRTNGEFGRVAETDWDWRSRPAPERLKFMLGQAVFYAGTGADLLMPTPDVLAALDGRPTAGFWSAPVPVTARHVEEGWLVVGYSGPGMEERVEAKNPECGEADCPWPGDCTLLTIGDDKPQHFADWSTLTVRLPCRVTR